MQKALKNTTKTEEKIGILKKFSDSFLMTPEYWKLLLNLEQEKLLRHKEEDEIINKALTHFYFPEHHQLLNHIAELVVQEKNIECNQFTFNDRSFYIGNEPKSYKEAIKNLRMNMLFPRENLYQIYEAYIKFGAKPVSLKEKMKYKNALNLYNKFQRAGNDDQKWLQCIQELDDEEVVTANIELRLGRDQHYRNRAIWKYYIENLRDRNPMAMLDVYRRYCRLFISDNETREEYRKEIERIEKMGKSASDFWIDTVKWENDFGTSAKPVSLKEKMQYKNALNMYNKFQRAGNNDAKWLECIQELDDEEVVTANIELRLGRDQHYRNRAIWKYYVEYLRDRNPMAMLDVYRRYCRLFISDNETREEYRKEIERIEKLGKSASDFWIDTVKWENDFGTSGAEIQQRAMASMLQEVSDNDLIKNVQSDKPQSVMHFKNCAKPLPQTTAFPPTMIKFMLKNANPEMLHIIHQTCKYFFILYPFPVCHRLVIHPYTIRPIQYIEQSLFLPQNTAYFKGLQNIYLSHTLIIVVSSKETNILSTIISKLKK
uniref:Uncharacterized protein n=1 Tax=Panagrolaimus sp. ES5 TaxID=591445 RepID=A0AC34FAS5_9BILA